MTIEAIIDLAAPLRDVLERARGSARVKVE
jgi:hypothetical protein